MKIRKHSESHLVELEDGSRWQIFPGDIDLTLNWQTDVELKLVRVDDEASSHALVSLADNSSVRVLPGKRELVHQGRQGDSARGLTADARNLEFSRRNQAWFAAYLY
jgi:hypothetical protein